MTLRFLGQAYSNSDILEEPDKGSSGGGGGR